MREIKFRMWNPCGKHFHYELQAFECLEQQQFKIYDHEKDGCAFEQFTGLQDRDGKEIYEGDIIRYDDITEVGDTRTVTTKLYGVKNVLHYIDHLEWIPSSGEIVGNIHENPELLESNP